MLEEKASFTKEDFITLFHSYDEYQTTVLQADNLSMYSPQGAALLMQGGAKTVLYAAMYCEGKYTGAISYVTCREKRYWTRQNRKELGEVTRIISAHLARTLTPAGSGEGPIDMVEYDSLTGLKSFSRFRIELERLIIGNYVASNYLLYIDFADFKFFNQKYGYSQGDKVLKEFCNFVIQKLESLEGVHFTRVVSDQFLLLVPHRLTETATLEECEETQRFFSSLRALGIRTAIDDFGAGYSALNSIINVPADTIKLDRAFIQNCSQGEREAFFLKRIIGTIHGLGFHAVCECVEMPAQADLLREAGCEEAQGFLFSKPLPIEDYEALVYPEQEQEQK